MFGTRWNPFNRNNVWGQMQQMQDEMNRLFSRWGDGRSGWGYAAFPAVNVWEEDDALFVEAELPGLNLADLEIFVTGHNQLTIKGERKVVVPDKSRLHRQERGMGNFVRTLSLPFPVDENKVDARLENGVLMIHLPKHEAARPRKITVKA
jgi:HSP20 family protein